MEHFRQYGEIESAVILKHINTGQSRGFGFITFKDEDVAIDLVENVRCTMIHGRQVDIKSAQPKMGGNQTPKQDSMPPGKGRLTHSDMKNNSDFAVIP
jgi:RNA recognition motif-containing protein